MNKKLIATLILLFSLNALAQSDIKMQTQYGSENPDVMSLLEFEEIKTEKVIFKGNDLNKKDYKISVKKIVNGKLEKEEVVFDSKESDYFKIKNNQFSFRFLSKIAPGPKAVFELQFNGFSKRFSYDVENYKDVKPDFALKNFLADKKEISISLNTNNYIFTYMMPYVRKDGSTSYCEVVQSETKPEDLGKKYNIPTYFLFDIKFY